MGLRTKSDWQSLPKQGNVPGLTPKQEDMSTARSPLAGQDMNEPKPKEQGNVASVQQQEQAEIEKQQKEAQGKTAQQAQQQQQSGIGQAVEQAAAKMGNFAHSLRARVNQLLTGAAQTTGMGQAKSEFVWDPKAQTSVLKVTEGAEDISSVVAEKRRQQELLKGTLTPFAQQVGDKLQAKSFGQVVKEQMGESPEVTRMMQMITAMQDLEAQGLQGSPEARALEAQLQAMDKFGMVTSLRDAMSEYNRMMGLSKDEAKWYGDAGDTGYSALDLAELGEDVIKSEVEKAKSFSSGLFGGDFEENLQKMYDTESVEGQRAARRAEQLHGELFEAFKTYSNQMDTAFQSERESIRQKMDVASKGVLAALELTPEGREAIQWLDMLGGGKDKDLVSTLMTALSDPNSGLGKEQRDAILQFIGKVGESSGGQLNIWLESLGKSGKIPFTVDGKTTLIEPSGDQKLEILNLMQDANIPAAEKNERLKTIVKNIGLDSTTNIGSSVDAALNTAKATGNMDMALGTFSASLVKSLQTFANSRTEDAVRAALGVSVTDWEKLSPDDRGNKIRQVLKEKPELIESVKKQIKDKQVADQKIFEETLKTNKEQAIKSVDQLNRFYNEDKGVPSGSFAIQVEKFKDVPNQIVSQMGRDLFHIMQVGDVGAGYASKIANNAWVANGIATGTLPPTFAADLGMLFAYQESLKNVRRNFPGSFYALNAAQGIDLAWVDLTKYAMQSPGNIAKIRASMDANMEKQFKDGRPSADLQKHMLDALNIAKKNPTRYPEVAAALNLMNQADVGLKKTLENIENVKKARAEIDKGMATMNEMSADMQIPVFNPDEIINSTLGFARGIEDILGGRIPEGVKVPSIEDLTALIPQITKPSEPGKEPGEIPEKLKLVLETLGLPMDAWSIKGGIPHIRMGDGKYIPVDSKVLTDITANMRVPSGNFAPQRDVTVALAPKNFAPKAGGPDISAMKLPPPPPPPKGTKVLEGKQLREADNAFKKAGAATDPTYRGYTVTVQGSDGSKWYQRVIGMGTSPTGAQVLKLAVVPVGGGSLVVGEIPYTSNGDGNVAITGADGRAFVVNQNDLARGIAAIGQSVVDGAYSKELAAQIVRRDPTISSDYGKYLGSRGKGFSDTGTGDWAKGKSSLEQTGASKELTREEKAQRENMV